MGAFAFVIDTILFLQCGLTFCLDCSPANRDPILKILEQLATALFNDSMLQEKHKHHLDKLQWDTSLARCKQQHFAPSAQDLQNKQVHLPNGLVKPMPHHFFVNDNIYSNIFDSYQIWQAAAVLGDLDLPTWQDPVLFDKLEDMPIGYSSCILSQIINTQCMDIETPPKFIAHTIRLLKKHSSPHCKVFLLQNTPPALSNYHCLSWLTSPLITMAALRGPLDCWCVCNDSNGKAAHGTAQQRKQCKWHGGDSKIKIFCDRRKIKRKKNNALTQKSIGEWEERGFTLILPWTTSFFSFYLNVYFTIFIIFSIVFSQFNIENHGLQSSISLKWSSLLLQMVRLWHSLDTMGIVVVTQSVPCFWCWHSMLPAR